MKTLGPDTIHATMPTDDAFRRFVDDMLQLLICFPQLDSDLQKRMDNHVPLRPRQIPFVTISELIAKCRAGLGRPRTAIALSPKPDNLDGLVYFLR